jgi:hypothetical protein
MIVKSGKKWKVVSKHVKTSGPNAGEHKSLGSYSSKGEAVKRLRQVEWFKRHG